MCLQPEGNACLHKQFEYLSRAVGVGLCDVPFKAFDRRKARRLRIRLRPKPPAAPTQFEFFSDSAYRPSSSVNK